MPLIATSRIHEPAEAEALLAAGAADAVGMTRALIADPDLPRRLVEGREDERILCTGCNQGCIGHYHLGLPISCLQNPRTGREARLPEPAPQAGSSVLVVGRRPGGHGRCRGRGARRRRCHAGSRPPVRWAGSSRSPAARPRTARPLRASPPTGGAGSRARASASAWTRRSTRRRQLAIGSRSRDRRHRRDRPPAAADAATGRRGDRRLGGDPRSAERERPGARGRLGRRLDRPRRRRDAGRGGRRGCGSRSRLRSSARRSTSTSASSTWPGSSGSA